MLSYINIFWPMAVIFMALTPLVVPLRKPTPRIRGAAGALRRQARRIPKLRLTYGRKAFVSI